MEVEEDGGENICNLRRIAAFLRDHRLEGKTILQAKRYQEHSENFILWQSSFAVKSWLVIKLRELLLTLLMPRVTKTDRSSASPVFPTRRPLNLQGNVADASQNKFSTISRPENESTHCPFFVNMTKTWNVLMQFLAESNFCTASYTASFNIPTRLWARAHGSNLLHIAVIPSLPIPRTLIRSRSSPPPTPTNLEMTSWQEGWEFSSMNPKVTKLTVMVCWQWANQWRPGVMSKNE